MSLARCLLAVVIVTGFLPGRALALTCSVDASDVVFGSVSPLAGLVTDASATITIQCSELIASTSDTTVSVCVNIGSGSGGDDGVANRHLQGSSLSLDYNLYKDSARSQIWGSNSVFAASGGVRTEVALTGIVGLFNTGSTTLTVYARLDSALQNAEAGAYASNLTGQIEARYAFSDTLTCASGAGQSASDSSAVSADIAALCVVSVNDLDFGAHTDLAGAIDAASSASLACTNGLPYSFEFGAGSAPGATEATRALRSTAGDSVGYQLYRDAPRTLVWGAAGNSRTGTGSGTIETLPIYARIPAQALPPPGAYQDSVIATVSF